MIPLKDVEDMSALTHAAIEALAEHDISLHSTLLSGELHAP